MAEPQPASSGLTDETALSCCSDPDPSTKVGDGGLLLGDWSGPEALALLGEILTRSGRCLQVRLLTAQRSELGAGKRAKEASGGVCVGDSAEGSPSSESYLKTCNPPVCGEFVYFVHGVLKPGRHRVRFRVCGSSCPG